MKQNKPTNMKKIFLICMISLGCYSIAHTQQTEQEVRKLLMHKWKITGMDLDGRTIPMPEEMTEFFTFKANNIFIDNSDGKDSKGKWTYNHKTKTITTTEDGDIQLHKIVKLTGTDLVVTAKTDEGMSNLLLKRTD